MNFFERPRLVTAVILFIETILVLLKVEYFLFLSFGDLLIALVLLTMLPFGFHAVYSYILNDLEEVEPKETSKEDIPVQKPEDVLMNLNENPVKEESIQESSTEVVQHPEADSTLASPKRIVALDDLYQEEGQDEELAKENDDVISEPVATKKANPSRMERKRKARNLDES